MGLDSTLWISIFVATEWFFTETMLGNKLLDIKRFSLQKISNNQNSSFNLTSQVQFSNLILSVNKILIKHTTTTRLLSITLGQ